MQKFASTKSYFESTRRELSKSGFGMSLRPLVMILCHFECLGKMVQKEGGTKKKSQILYTPSPQNNVHDCSNFSNEIMKHLFRNQLSPLI